MITRTVISWEHNFATATVTVHLRVRDDVEGTDVTKHLTYPENVLPPALATWESATATSLGAALATVRSS